MSIASRITSIEEHIENAYDSIKKFGVDTSVINRNIENIANVINDDIYDKLPKVTQSGAGFTLENVQNGQVDDFKMIGVDLEQETVETITISDWVQGFIDENSGKFVSRNDDITTDNFISIFPNILYNISRTIYTSYMRFRFYDENKNYLGYQVNVDVTTNKEDNRMLEGVTSMQLTINDDRVKYMKICDHSNDLSAVYTITTNATPSPIYPQAIKVVEGRQVITDKGKNLLDSSKIQTLTQNGITCTYDSNKQEITFNGTCNSDNTLFQLNNTKVLAQKNITKFIAYYVSGTLENYARLRFYDSNYMYGIIMDITNLNSSNDKITMYSDDRVNTSNYINNSFRFNNGSVANNFKIKVMVTDNENTDFEPYYEPVSYNIDLTNDLLKYNKCDFTPTTTTWYFLNGSGSAYGSNIGTKTDIKFPVEINKKYTLRYNISIAPNTFQLCYENENVVATLGKSSGNNTFTFTSDRNGYVIPRVQVQANTQVKITDISAVEGEEDYYDYKLAKMPNTDYKNRIYKNNGNWYFEEKVKKVVLDGSEIITIQNIGTDNWYYQLSVNCYKTDQLKQICSHYNNSGIYNSNTYQGIMMLTDGNFIRIRYGEEDTVANFKAWLSNNNVTLWYPLVNPVTTQITNATLINQLEAISVHTGTNIITISNDNNIIPEIEVTRLKELEKLS